MCTFPTPNQASASGVVFDSMTQVPRSPSLFCKAWQIPGPLLFDIKCKVGLVSGTALYPSLPEQEFHVLTEERDATQIKMLETAESGTLRKELLKKVHLI